MAGDGAGPADEAPSLEQAPLVVGGHEDEGVNGDEVLLHRGGGVERGR